MRAVQFDRFGSPDVLIVGPFPEPHPSPGEVRVAVAAAGVSPVDVLLRAGMSPLSQTLTLPHVPGVDAAGVVDEIGSGVSGVAIGDEVFGAVDVARLGGASAELAVLQFWAAKPAPMSWEQAGAAGTSVETATRVLDALEVGDGTVLLIDGASGGVGSIAVQLATARGATVIGTAHPEGQAFVAELGATPTIYGPGLPQRIRDLEIGRVDRALDIAGAGSLPELVSIVGSAASVLTIADFTAPECGVRMSVGAFVGERNGRHGLRTAAELFTEGRFRVPLRHVFSMEQAAHAHTLAEHGPRQGKIALTGLIA
jgi:NADPH:quinone reductase-like Zn-dependent oxidoreductase